MLLCPWNVYWYFFFGLSDLKCKWDQGVDPPYNADEGSLFSRKSNRERWKQTCLAWFCHWGNRWGEVKIGMAMGSERMYSPQLLYSQSQTRFCSPWALEGRFDSSRKSVKGTSEKGRFAKKSLSRSLSPKPHTLSFLSTVRETLRLFGKMEETLSQHIPPAPFRILTFEPKAKLEMTISNRLFGII